MPKGIKGFQKGNKHRLGKKHSKETRERLSKLKLGFKHSEETKKKISLAKLGDKNPAKRKEVREKISRTTKLQFKDGRKPTSFWKDKKMSGETKKKMGESHKGEKAYNWKGDKIGKDGIHRWLFRNYGKADKCENRECQFLDFKCSGKSILYDWANMNNHIYRRKRKDFKKLCKSCHIIYDRNNKK